MTNRHHIRALRLLAEDARLTDRLTDLLAGLVLINPVALRGEPTMMPSTELMGVLGIEHAGNGRNQQAVREMTRALDDMVQARWSLPSRHGVVTGTFLDHYQLSSESGFLHFQMNTAFIRVLEKISRNLARDDY
jgi:hypothetical protein